MVPDRDEDFQEDGDPTGPIGEPSEDAGRDGWPIPPEDAGRDGWPIPPEDASFFGRLLGLLDADGASREGGTARSLGDERAGELARGGDEGPSLEGARIGRFEIIRPLGSGGFGLVVLALDPSLNRLVAVKMPRPEMIGSRVARQRFLTEAKAAAALDHPGIVPIYESERLGLIAYIASAFVDGPTLEQWLRGRSGKVGPEDAARLLVKLADAVQHAHGRGVLHRDLKPANVLLQWDGPSQAATDGAAPSVGLRPLDCLSAYTPRLTDFGLAKLVEAGEQDRTGTGLPVGTPPYMAPEQASGRSREVDARADIYALGAILYEVLTGRPPFQGESNLETIRLVIEGELITPHALHPRLPRDLETIVLTCLRKEPRRRYPSARALAEDLTRFLHGEPIRARPVPAWERVLKWGRKHPYPTASIALLVVMVAGALAVTIWSNAWLRAHNAELETERNRARASESEMRRQRDLADRHAYASQLQLARHAFDAGQHRLAQVLLRDMVPTSAAQDDREFAWHYLHEKARAKLKLVGEVDFRILDESVSPNGRVIATREDLPNEEYEIAIWDTESARPLHLARGPRGDLMRQIGVTQDNRYCAQLIMSKLNNRTYTNILFHIINTVDGMVGEAVPLEDGWAPIFAAFGAGDRFIAVHEVSAGGASGRITVWDFDPAVGQVAPAFRYRRVFSDVSLMFPCSQRAIVREGKGEIQVLDVAAGATIARLGGVPGELTGRDAKDLLEGVPSDDVNRQVQIFSPDATIFAIATKEEPRRAQIWNTTTGERLAPVVGFASPIHRIDVQPTNQALVIVEESRATWFCDQRSGRKRAIHPESANPVHEGTDQVAFSREGDHFALVRRRFNQPCEIEVRSATDGALVAVLVAPEFGLASVAFIPGHRLALRIERSLWLWNWGSEAKGPESVDTGGEVWSLAYSPDGGLLATGSDNGRQSELLGLWRSGSERRETVTVGHDGTITGLAFTPDGHRLITCALEGKAPVRLWEVPGMQPIRALEWPEAEGARSVAIGAGGSYLAVAGNRGGVRIWDMETWRVVATLTTGDRVHRVVAHPSRPIFVAVDDTKSAWVIEAPTGRVIAQWLDKAVVYGMDFHPNGGLLATADRDGTIHLRDTATWGVARRIHSDDGELRTVAFSPDGRTLASGGRARVVKLWDPVVGEQLLALDGHQEQINAIAFARIPERLGGGECLASGDHAGRVIFWKTGPPDEARRVP